MMVISPVRMDERLSVGTRSLCGVVNSVGSDAYGDICFGFLKEALNAEHWALFRYRANQPVKCIATGSGRHKAAAKQNIDRFVVRCHSVDPCVQALNGRSVGPALTKLAIDDIEDEQYRHCFELTHVRELLSFLSWMGKDLYQLSVFRGPHKELFSSGEMSVFAAIANVLLVTAQKHEILMEEPRAIPKHLDIDGIERFLKLHWPTLSLRECEVCARAVAGQTIEGTSLELDIRRTSVITYRQRAYDKLGVSRANELVALLNNLHAERILAA